MQIAVSNEKLICLISIDNILAVIMKQIEIEIGPCPTDKRKQTGRGIAIMLLPLYHEI
jgi:hypothetical protein